MSSGLFSMHSQARRTVAGAPPPFSLIDLATKYDDFLDEISKWEELSGLSDRISSRKSTFLGLVEQFVINKTSNAFSVLNHGDIRPANLLIKHDSNGRASIALKNFGQAVWSTPAFDLFALLHLNVAENVRVRHEFELLQLYFNQFVVNLKALGHLHKIPAMLDFQVDLLQHGFLSESFCKVKCFVTDMF